MNLPGNHQEKPEQEQPSEAVEVDAATMPAGEPESEGERPVDAAAERADDDAGELSDLDAETLSHELESARAELAEMKEHYLRAKAEVENVRRRAEQEIAKARKFAVENFAVELLSVKDSLDLAANVELGGRDDPVVANMHEGLSLTRRQLDTVFEKFGIAELDPEPGEKLNPDLHQAMSIQESGEVAPNHILQVIQKGFTLNDRLLRPAMVIVARAPSA